MKYWIYQDNQVKGPFDRAQIGKMKGFDAESLVCPEGRKGTEMGDWQRASSVAELSLLIQSDRVATATLPHDDSGARDAIDELKRRVNDFETRIERMQKELDERAQAAAPAPAEPDRETLRKLEEIDDKLVALSALEGDVRKLRERVEELENRPAVVAPAEPAAAPLPAPALTPAPVATPAPAADSAMPPLIPSAIPELSVVKVEPAKSPAFQPMEFKVETFEKVELQAPPPLPAPAPIASAPPVLTPPPQSSESPSAVFSPEPSPLPALSPAPSSNAGSPFSTPPPFSAPLSTPIPNPFGPAATPMPSPFGAPSSLPPSPFGPQGTTPLSDFVLPQAPTPFPSMVGEAGPPKGLPPVKSPTEASDLMATPTPTRRSGSKKATVIFLFVCVLALGGGLIYVNFLDMKHANKHVAPLGNTTTIPSDQIPSPPMPGPISSKGGPLGGDLPTELPPADFSQSAVDLVKSFVPPGGRAVLSDVLEKQFPSKGGLSPWMVEPLLGQNKYQVTFYVGTRPVYVFLVQPKNKSVEGVNDAAKSLLNGQLPKLRSAAPAIKRPRRIAKKRPAAVKSDTMIVAPQNSKGGDNASLDDLLKDDAPSPKKGQ